MLKKQSTLSSRIETMYYGDSILNQTDFSRFLGLNLDQNLRFNKHIDSITLKLSKSVGILNRIKHFMPRAVMINLYYTLVQPYMFYVIQTWFGAPHYLRKKIVTLQKKAIRCVYNLSYSEHTSIYFNESKILKIQYLYS